MLHSISKLYAHFHWHKHPFHKIQIIPCTLFFVRLCWCLLNLNIQDENEFTNIKNNSEIMRKVTIKTTVFSCHQNSMRGWGGDIKVWGVGVGMNKFAFCSRYNVFTIFSRNHATFFPTSTDPQSHSPYPQSPWIGPLTCHLGMFCTALCLELLLVPRNILS